jgi:hypothetical protein
VILLPEDFLEIFQSKYCCRWKAKVAKKRSRVCTANKGRSAARYICKFFLVPFHRASSFRAYKNVLLNLYILYGYIKKYLEICSLFFNKILHLLHYSVIDYFESFSSLEKYAAVQAMRFSGVSERVKNVEIEK